MNLTVQQLLHILHPHFIGEFQNALNGQQGPVALLGVGGAVLLGGHQNGIVLLQQRHIIVVILDLRRDSMALRILEMHLHKEVLNALGQLAGAKALGNELPGLLHILRRHALQNLQFTVGITTHNSQNGRHGNAALTLRIGNHNAHHVLHNVAAAQDLAGYRLTSQRLACQCGHKGDRDGLCTPHSGDEFFLENLYTVVIQFFLHNYPSKALLFSIQNRLAYLQDGCGHKSVFSLNFRLYHSTPLMETQAAPPSISTNISGNLLKHVPLDFS